MLLVLEGRDRVDLGGEVVRQAVGEPAQAEHVNGHAGVANSAALQAAKVDDATPDADGGQFVRDAAGHLTGVLLEDAEDGDAWMSLMVQPDVILSQWPDRGDAWSRLRNAVSQKKLSS